METKGQEKREWTLKSMLRRYLYNKDGYQANTAAHNYHFDTENLSRVGILVIPLCNFPDFSCSNCCIYTVSLQTTLEKVFLLVFFRFVWGFLINSGRTPKPFPSRLSVRMLLYSCNFKDDNTGHAKI